MRLVKQVQLFFQEGTSDKVYEVDLCEAAEGEFVVNFRYGRRGARLQEGTKTPFPENRERAELIFDRLVDSKKNKGYREASDPAGPPPLPDETPAAQPPSLPAGDPRRDRVRAHLRSAAAGQEPRNWSLSRILWRAGELNLGDSVEDLIQLGGKGEMSDYSLAWALGRTANPAAVPKLRELRQSSSEKVRRIAGEALARCLPEGERAAFLDEIRQQLPAEIKTALESNDAEAVTAALQNSLRTGPPPHEPFYLLYLVGSANSAAREAVYEAIKSIDFRAPWFRSLRHIFKAAEMRLDAEIYGAMAYRFEKSPASFSAGWGWIWDDDQRKSVRVSEAAARPDSKWGYSSKTRNYLRRRIIKMLRRAGEISDPASFIPLATGVLIAYDDDVDSTGPKQETRYDWDWQASRSTTTIRHFDDYAGYLAFNFLLYTNSERYEFIAGSSRWNCRAPYQPGQPAPATREEAFPHLWDQAPDAIEHLLRNSRAVRVHEFAVKVWRANPGFKDRVTIDLITVLLGQPFEVTQKLGLDLAREAWDPTNPDNALILALAGCPLAEAQNLALEWLRGLPNLIKEDADFATSLLLIPHTNVHNGVRDLLSRALLSQDQIEQLLPRVVVALMDLSEEAEHSAQIARQVRETLLIIASGKLGDIGFEVVRDLVAHQIDEVQLLGAQILLQHTGSADDTPDDILFALLDSESEAVRGAGMELFGRLSDSALLERADILASFCISKKQDVRQAVRPIVQRLANVNRDFAHGIVAKFYPILMRKEEYEGLHEDVFALLEGPLGDHLDAIPANSHFRMFDSKYRHGQLLGLLLLKKRGGLGGQPMKLIVNVASCETLEVREYIWAYFRQHVEHVKADKKEALRILDSDWEDTREFALEFFRTQFAESDWDPDTLVSICDSTRGEVQDLGRELITRFFNEADGRTYLLKLAQHPAPELQAFASNYLDRFARNDIENLKALEWYFTAVLSQVNRGRVAKDRAQQLLLSEALKTREAAEFVMNLLTRQSATVAILDKATHLKSMHAISKKWPDIPTPFTIRPKPRRDHTPVVQVSRGGPQECGPSMT